MKIKSLYANFGNLRNAALKLTDGLNIVEAPNESGKSTWCAFIRAMLYGINTSDRDKTGHLSDKNRYRPWSGDAMGGTMEIEHGGKSITLQRSALGSAPMKKFSAVYTGTGEVVDYLSNSNPGEKLTGVTESVFERTAFIRQSGIQIDNANDLEKRIASIVSSGDEQQSYSETDETLRTWQRKLKYKKSGLIPQLEAELNEAESLYAAIQSAADGISDMRQETERLKTLKSQLEADLDTIEKLEARSDAKTVWEAKKKAEAKKSEYAELQNALTVNSHVLSRDDTAALREACASLPPLEELTAKAKTSAGIAEAAAESAKTAVKASPLYPMSADDADDRADRAEALEKKASEAVNKLLPKKTRITLLTVATALFIFAVCAILIIKKPVIAAISAVIAMALGVLVIIRSVNRDNSAAYLKVLLSDAGFDSVESLRQATSDYIYLLAASNREAAEAAAAKKNLETAVDTLLSAKKSALEKIRLIIPDVTDASLVGARIGKIEEMIDRCNKAEFEAAAARNTFDTLLAKHGGELPELDETYIAIPIRNREDTKAYLSRTAAQFELQNEKYNLAVGRLKAMGDPAIISGRIKELREKLAGCNEKYASLELAVSVLADANNELSRRFSPLISAKAGEIMSRLTGGKYESLIFDKSFDAQVKHSGEPISRPALALSTGANDQLYLALRLAMCQTVLPDDEPCPIILDDALVNLDDERAKTALNELLRIAEKRQVILFTCHSREAKLLEGVKNITVISA